MANNTLVFKSSDKSDELKNNQEVYLDISLNSSPKSTIQGVDFEQSKFKIEKSVNVKAVQNALHNLFTWIPGERVLFPEWGNRLYEYLYEGITEYNKEMIISEIESLVRTEEPRVVISEVVEVIDPNNRYLYDEDNTINLNIVYYIKGLEHIKYVYEYKYTKQ